jgi:DNA polymerase
VGETLEDFRGVALRLIQARVAPHAVQLLPAEAVQPSLLDWPLPLGEMCARVTVPQRFVELASRVALHRSLERWNLLYRLLFRLAAGERRLLENELDADVRQLYQWAKEVAHDLHKCEAFLRFRKVQREGREHYVAWLQPLHRILPLLASFFVRRLPGMSWSILTPDGSAHWDMQQLHFGRAASPADMPEGDEVEPLWRGYYASTFNPARVNPKAMRKEMPLHYWKDMPETSLIAQLLDGAKQRTDGMTRRSREVSASESFLPAQRDLTSLAQAAAHCTACPLHERATQTVWGEGPSQARLLLVGEQPGDTEDIEGKPFVGPAGQLLDEALSAAGIARSEVYITNAVKHFKWQPGDGKRRIHQRPSRAETIACQGWLYAEVAAVRPELILCLGATAAQSFMGPSFKLMPNRGRIFSLPDGRRWMATYHPSALLRADPRNVARMKQEFQRDLQSVSAALSTASSGSSGAFSVPE